METWFWILGWFLSFLTIIAKQLRFNHQMSLKTHHEKSALIMMGIVIRVFLVCYGMYLRCGL